MFNAKGSGNKTEYILKFVCVLICVLILGLFVSKKEGYHMDELLSFELSNAEFNPWIVPTQPQGRLAKYVQNEIKGENIPETFGNIKDTVVDVINNRGASKLLSYKADVYDEPVWIDKQTFDDYIMVNSEDAFNYLSVYFNVKDDNHPPIHFMLLHTVSSIFKGKISPFIGCGINISAVVCILLLLYSIAGRFACKFGLDRYSKMIGLCVTLCYGLSAGAIATTLLIRMYALLTLMCVWYFKLILDKWDEKSFDKKNFLLAFVTICGFLTQYFFLFYVLVLALITFILLFISKRTKEAFCFVRTMVLSAVAGLALFPFAVSDVLSSERGVEALDNLSEGFSGYGHRLFTMTGILADKTMGIIVLILTVIIGILFVITKCILKTTSDDNGKIFKDYDSLYTIIMLVIPVITYLLLASRMSPYLVDRYIMPIFPLVIMIEVLVIFGAAVFLEQKFKKLHVTFIVMGLLIIIQVCGMHNYDGEYLYSGYGKQQQISVDHSALPCICLYEGVGYYENLVEFAGFEKTLLLTISELEDRIDRRSIDELDEFVLIVKEEVDFSEAMEVLDRDYGKIVDISLLEDSVYGDRIFLMKCTE